MAKLSFNAFHEGTRRPHGIKMHKRLYGVDVKKIGGDTSRELSTSNGIHTSFGQKGKRAKEKREKDFVREDLAIQYIFFGIHTADAVELSGRIAELQPAAS